jgi:hypothetical protein
VLEPYWVVIACDAPQLIGLLGKSIGITVGEEE